MSEPREGKEPPYPNPVYAWYVVFVLLLAYTFSFIDRQILSLLVEPIKRDLQISDTEMSLLLGFSFALFYTIMGLPIGRLVDKHSRRLVIGIGIFTWSIMTALCGVARNYWILFIARMGVGVGEAALSPGAWSMISDYMPPERRGTAMGVYATGVYIGAGLALIIGGVVVELAQDAGVTVLPVLGEIYPWQITFFVVGLPGILVALLMVTVKEPTRRGAMRMRADVDGEMVIEQVPIADVLTYMKANWQTIFFHNMSYAMIALIAYGSAAWIPAFLIRTYGFGPGDAGLYFGLIVLFFGTTGTVFGGWLADHLTTSRLQLDGKMRVLLYSAIAALPFAVVFPFMEAAWLALLIVCPSTFFLSFIASAGPAGINEIMPQQLRGQASAFMIFVVNIIGLGMGPTSIALVTDFVYGDPMAIRYSLAIVGGISLVLAALLAAMGFKHYRRSHDHLAEYNRLNGGPEPEPAPAE